MFYLFLTLSDFCRTSYSNTYFILTLQYILHIYSVIQKLCELQVINTKRNLLLAATYNDNGVFPPSAIVEVPC